MICTQVTQISHSTVGSSFSVSFSADSTPNDLEMLRMMREWFMRWNNSGVSFTKADTPQNERRTDRDGDVWEWRGDAWYCIGQADTPQTDCYDYSKSEMENIKCGNGITTEIPQTDCGWK